MRLGIFVAALTLLPFSWAQPPNTVTVNASQSSAAQPDQAVFSISVASGVSTNLDDVVKALSGTGITAANLYTISGQLPAGPTVAQAGFAALQITWTFQLVVPLANVQTETASLTALQKTIPQNNSGLSLSFVLQNAQVSTSQAQSCDLVALVANARAQAQALAAAAGNSVT